jgi:hypothetical protein
MKPYPETHQEGFMSIEKDLKSESKMVDFGIQIAEDGRIWICINGVSVIRFSPLIKEYVKESLL